MFSTKHLLRIMHRMYHVCNVSPQCGYGHVSSTEHLLRIVLSVDTDMSFQIITS